MPNADEERQKMKSPEILIMEAMEKAGNGQKLEKAKEALAMIKMFKADATRGSVQFLRDPGQGKEGELWFRNKLLWMKTLPLNRDELFLTLCGEAGVYREGWSPRYSADLLGLWHDASHTRLCVIELKACKGKKNELSTQSILYAMIEGCRNLLLFSQSMPRLRRDWMNKFIQSELGKANSSVWRQSPFQRNLTNFHLVVMGDSNWRLKQKGVMGIAEELSKYINDEFKIKTDAYSFPAQAESKSSPYMLFPLKKFL